MRDISARDCQAKNINSGELVEGQERESRGSNLAGGCPESDQNEAGEAVAVQEYVFNRDNRSTTRRR